MKEDNNVLIRVVLLVIIILFMFVAIYNGYKRGYYKSQEENQINEYWACMDGCSNMLEILESPVTYNNLTQKAWHDECSLVCSNQYFTTRGEKG